jgi:hypothetical protein
MPLWKKNPNVMGGDEIPFTKWVFERIVYPRSPKKTEFRAV